MQVEHPNIVKFHKYWLDMKESQARVRGLHTQHTHRHTHTHSHYTLILVLLLHRLYSSQNTCRQAALSSSWRKLRRTTRPWMWRSVFPVWSHTVLVFVLRPITLRISCRIRGYVTGRQGGSVWPRHLLDFCATLWVWKPKPILLFTQQVLWSLWSVHIFSFYNSKPRIIVKSALHRLEWSLMSIKP